MIETEDWDKVQEIVEYSMHTSLKIRQSLMTLSFYNYEHLKKRAPSNFASQAC